MWQVVSKHYKDDEPVPITMCFGLPPSCTLMAGAGFDYVILPQGCDEIGIAGAIQGTPVRMVKARTVDAYAVADCEVVLEGYVNPRDRRYETAEAEEAGFRAVSTSTPNGRATWASRTRRRRSTAQPSPARKHNRPIIFPLAVHTLDEHNIDTTIREAAMFNLCDGCSRVLFRTW